MRRERRQWMQYVQQCVTGVAVFILLTGCSASTRTAVYTPVNPTIGDGPTTVSTANTTMPTGIAASTTVTATVATMMTTMTVTTATIPAGMSTANMSTEGTATAATATRPANSAQITRAVTTATSAADIAVASPSSRAAARSATLAATATSVALDTPRPPTPTFEPAPAPPRIATSAARTVAPAMLTPTGTGIPKEGTPFSIANPTAMAMPTIGVANRLPPPDGELVTVFGHRMWIACDGSGGPTVIMDAGVNSGSQAWTLVQPGIAKISRVCVYDRAGLGRSDSLPRPRTSQEVVRDLHQLLTNAGIPGPYVLVAHSFGGLNVRLYAAEYAQDVTGMVLVDPVHEDRFAATSKVLTPEQEQAFERGREGNPEGLDYYESSTLVRAIGKPLPNIPLIVIARGQVDPWPSGWPVASLEKVWRDLETDLASRAPQGTLWIAKDSSHNIPGYQPQIVVDATQRIVNTLRKR